MNLTNSMVLTKEEIKTNHLGGVFFVLVTFVGGAILFGFLIGIIATIMGIPSEILFKSSDDSSVGALINLSIFPVYLVLILLINKYFYKKTTTSLGFSSTKIFQNYFRTSAWINGIFDSIRGELAI